LLVFGFSAQSAEKPNTENGSTMLPFVLSEVEGQTESAPNASDRVAPVIIDATATAEYKQR
jgi:hypothetical protein